jgi:riboflavin synthase
MFTGLIETIGVIGTLSTGSGKSVITVRTDKFRGEVQLGDSIAINGVCLTVVAFDNESFQVEAVEETLSKTSLHNISAGDSVNLERALKVGDRLGGHFVLGHVDDTASVVGITKQDGSWLLTLDLSEELARYCIPVGSIAIDGISLTIARLDNKRVTISVIPHTWRETTLQHRSVGDVVNIEVDMIGKYVHKFVNPDSTTGSVSMDSLRNAGFV